MTNPTNAPAPGPAPDRAVLARAEADWRATPPDLAGWVSLSRDASRALMAEYDRRGAELDRWGERITELERVLRLLVDTSDMFIGPGFSDDWDEAMAVARALLGGEGR